MDYPAARDLIQQVVIAAEYRGQLRGESNASPGAFGCPRCGARPGQRCIGRPRHGMHSARLDLYHREHNGRAWRAMDAARDAAIAGYGVTE